MIFHVRTNKAPVSIKLRLTAKVPTKVFIVVFDPDHNDTEYIFREKDIENATEVSLNLPFSPNMVHVLIYDAFNDKNEYFDVSDIKVVSLVSSGRGLCVDSITAKFIEFCVQFSQIQGYAKPGIYKDKSGYFQIELLSEIMAGGKVVKTPYRIHKETSLIQASKKQCQRLSVSSRIALLLHEYSHNFLNENVDSEFEADRHALEIYTALQLPNVEGLYAFARIFHPNEESAERLEQILRYLGENDRKSVSQTWTNIQNDII